MPMRRSGLTIAGLPGVVAMAGRQGPPGAAGVPDVRNRNRRRPGAGEDQIVTEVSDRAEVAAAHRARPGIKSVEVHWPARRTSQVFTDMPLERVIEIRGDRAPVVIRPR